MVRPQYLLADRQRALIQVLGLGVAALGLVEPRQVVEAESQARVLEPELLRFLERSREPPLGARVITSLVCLLAGSDMTFPQPLSFGVGCGLAGDSADRRRLLFEWLRVCVATLCAVELGQAFEARGEVGVICPQRLLADRQGALGVRDSIRVAAQGPVDLREATEQGGRLLVVGSELPLA